MKKDKDKNILRSDEEDAKAIRDKSDEVIKWVVEYASKQVNEIGTNDPNYYMLTALNIWFTLSNDIAYGLKQVFSNFNMEYAKELKKQKKENPKYGG